jgi:transcriptional regulator with XRE-family HTH domain
MGKTPAQQPNLPSPEEAFGTVLRAARKRAGLAQDILAFKAGYHRNYISELERGWKSPSLRTIVNLATVLDTKPSLMLKHVEKLIGDLSKAQVETPTGTVAKQIPRRK